MDVSWQLEPRFQPTTQTFEPVPTAALPRPAPAAEPASSHEQAHLQSQSLSGAMGLGDWSPTDLATHGQDIHDIFRRTGWE